jgi:hypothetical protein
MIQHSNLASSDERQQGSSLGKKATDSSNDDPAMLFLFSSPHRSGTLRRNNECSQRSGYKKNKEKREGKEGVQI